MPASIGQALAAAQKKIDAVDACVLLAHVLGREGAYLIAHAEEPLDPVAGGEFEALVERRAIGEPVAYITGRREFFGLDLKVTPAVLIPRPETELLVELALERIPPQAPCRILDLGTGSGCVAIAVARHRPLARVTAVDSSREALAVARENAARLRTPGISFVSGSWFEPLAEARFDLVVANPPYVAEGDPHLAQGDLRFEPRAALVGGPDGLSAVRAIVQRAPSHLGAGWLLLEHGYDQAPACRKLLEDAGLASVRSWQDLSGIERVSGGRNA